tara:strand:+ start:566 stop:1807 length:1242 start_codon:yes stop_codon:yes gene_type:complete
MKNYMSFVILLAISFASYTSINAQGPDEYWIGLEAYAVHTDGELAGMTTWRMYIHMLDSDDFLSACTGSESNPWIMESTSSPAWFQHPDAGETFANAINPAFYTAFPNLEFDSWLTIGVEDSVEPMEILALADPAYDAFAAFDAGENVMSNTAVGNGWATLFPGLGAVNLGFAGEDLKVLIGQLTTSGDISGSIYVQIFPWGIQDPDLRLLLPILYAPSQCMDMEACNYDVSAWTNDDCEYGPSAGTIVGSISVVVGAGTSEWSYSCSDEAASYEWTITGGTILSGQGTSSVTVEWSGDVSDGVLSVAASSDSGCTGAASSISVDVVMGVEDLVFSQNLRVFPSPTSSTISVAIDGDYGSNNLCEIYSITGQKMMEFTLSQSEIDVTDLANGTYLITVNTDRGLIRQSFIVAK